MRGWYIENDDGTHTTATVEEYAAVYSGSGEHKRVVAKTRYEEGTVTVEISTVFLGLDHSFGMEGPPVLYETMVFGGKLSDHQERYHTREEAFRGHQRWVKRVVDEED